MSRDDARLEDTDRELAALKARRGSLQTPAPHDETAAAVLARMAEPVGHALPVPMIRWPNGTDPFAPPELLEAEAAA